MRRLQRVKTRARAGFAPARPAFVCAAPFGLSPFGLSPFSLAVVMTTCLLVAGCSPGVDYPSIFPAVHDMPPPRSDATMDQIQVQKATEDLITERDHLNAAAPPAKPASGSADQATGATAKKPAHKAPAKQAAAAPPATTASATGAGMVGAGPQGTPGAGLKP